MKVSEHEPKLHVDGESEIYTVQQGVAMQCYKIFYFTFGK
jgi:hypothetical protein